MPADSDSQPAAYQPQFYRIRLKGHLGQHWLDWFEGLEITLEAGGSTLLSGVIADQAALHGLLKKIRDLNLPLLSVNTSDPGSSEPGSEPR